MKTILEQGSYKVIQYTNSFICLDYITPSVGMTLKTFEDKEAAEDVYKAVIKKTSGTTFIEREALDELCTTLHG